MGWFDKKAWRLRRKIKDLQADLRDAERDGRYVVEQGLFFAELEDMGEMTMMVFGTTDLLASQEEPVIKTFFDRNGFAVEFMKMDKAHTGIADVELIPPEEMIRAVGRALKNDGYRMIDDSEQERKADIPQKIFPLSALVRAISVLFIEHVEYVIFNTAIKMNKEGNRLLHWMPKLREALQRKVEQNVVELTRPYFVEAYSSLYAKIGHMGEVSPMDQSQQLARSESLKTEPPKPAKPTDKIPGLVFPQRPPEEHIEVPAPPRPAPVEVRPVEKPPEKPKAVPAPPPAPSPEAMAAVTAAPPKAAKPAEPADVARIQKSKDATETLAHMYKHLIRANSTRCVRNAEQLLLEVSRLYEASATCVMVKVPHGHGLTIHAQAGMKLIWGDGGGEGFPVSSSILSKCIKNKTVTTSDEDADPTVSMVMHKIEATAAAPIFVDEEIVGILYIDRRGTYRPFSTVERDALSMLANVFGEFPDLTLGLTSS